MGKLESQNLTRGTKIRIGLLVLALIFPFLPLVTDYLLHIVILIFLRAGWLYPPQEKRKYLYYVFPLFLFLLVLSLLHVMYIAEPGHPILRADLTNRLWVPFAVVLAGIFARGLWS